MLLQVVQGMVEVESRRELLQREVGVEADARNHLRHHRAALRHPVQHSSAHEDNPLRTLIR